MPSQNGTREKETDVDLNYTAQEETFRAGMRAWLQANLPDDIRAKVQGHLRLSREDQARWHRILAAQGWSTPQWPVEFGGTGWNATLRHIWDEECGRAGAPRILPFGASMVAPVIMKFGNEAQQQHYLPRIRDCTDWWCQGYSEPGAGSDLASLKTRAELTPDGRFYVVNGQKTWTTLAHFANMIFCLVRTDPEAKPQAGITFLLIDMATPGITLRPILTLDEDHEVNEVFFDNVRVPVENRIGEENRGWTYAKVLLGYERTGIARLGACKRELSFLKRIALREQKDGQPLLHDPVFGAKVAELEIELMALEMTVLRIVSGETAGKGPGPETSMLKIKAVEVQQRLTELMMDAVGPYAQPFDTAYLDGENEHAVTGYDEAAPLAAYYLNYRKTSIYGGSDEVQRNIISKMILGL
nr:acyl-CoA dehydrogenase family protein [Bordetella trematum]